MSRRRGLSFALAAATVLLAACAAPRLGRRPIAQSFDEPLPVVPHDERRDDRPGLLEALEAVEVQALLLERSHEPLDAPVALGLPDVRRRDRDPEPPHLVDPR